MFLQIKSLLNKIRTERPLILNLTNSVTMDFVANGLLSLGASPIMTNAEEELEDLLKISKALVINIGTLDEQFVKLAKRACELANQLNAAIILDPVGVGASEYRTKTCLELMENYRFAIIRGNASEIKCLAGELVTSKGVDSLESSESAAKSALALAAQFKTSIVVSGATDIVANAEKFEKYAYGSALMPQITGSGCLLSAVVAAFHAVEQDSFEAAKLASIFYSLCGERAEKNSQGPGSFKVNFIDELSR